MATTKPKKKPTNNAVVTLIKHDGSVEQKEINADSLFRCCYPLIDCDTIEIVYLPKHKILLVDEDAGLKPDQVLNINASALSGRFILGNAVYCDETLLK